MTLCEQVNEILGKSGLRNDEISKSSYISRAGYAGHYKYKYYEPDGVSGGGLTKETTGISQNKLDAIEANTAPEIKNISLLSVNKKNYVSEGIKYLDETIGGKIKDGKVFCKATGQKVEGYNKKHLYINSHSEDEQIMRTKLLPFVLPVIEKYGKKGTDSRKMDYGDSVALLARTKIINNSGLEQKIGIKVVLAPNKNNQLLLDFVSIFPIESRLIKSAVTNDSAVTCHVSDAAQRQPAHADSQPLTSIANLHQLTKKINTNNHGGKTMKLVFNAEFLAKSLGCEEKNEIELEKCEVEKSENPNDPKFDYYKKLVLQHLEELEKKENRTVAKSVDIVEFIQKSSFPVGTVRTWNGQKFKKTMPGKWVRIYEKESRGAKMAVAALRRKAAQCKDSNELLQLVLANKERFVDNQGKPLGFMQEFSAYVSGLNDKHESGKKQIAESKSSTKLQEVKNKDSGGNGQTKKQGYTAKLRADLKDNLKPLFGLHKNKKTGIEANLSGKSVDKMSSDKAIEKSKANGFSVDEHFEVANKIVELYENADLVETSPDKKGSVNLLSIKRFDCNAKLSNGKEAIAHITVKESRQDGHKIYSVEVMDLEQKKSRFQTNGAGVGLSQKTGTQSSNSNIPQSSEKSSRKPKTLADIRDKYQKSHSITGDEDEIYVGKETIQGKWKLVEADAPSASHDEITFHKTEGFPTGANGTTINDRDYEHDTQAQETVMDIASDFDGRALGFDSPIVVTQDGVVTSGNNRTMSSKLAARKGTDKKYIEALKKRAKKFGFTADDVAKFEHPRVVFETEHKGDYTTDEFAKYNESGKKAKSPIEKAVEVSKRMKPQTVEIIAGNISQFDTMGELYADRKASEDVFNTLVESGIIQKTDLPQYITDGAVTAAGKEFVETVLIGSVIDEGNIRQLNSEGGKSIRQKLVKAIVPLIENKGMKGYSINKELNEAVGIAIEVSKNHDKFPNVEAFSHQQDMFRKLDPVSIELAKKLEGTQKAFAEFMQEMNGGLRPAANGEADIFFGGVESKEDIVDRILHIKQTVKKALDKFFGLFGKNEQTA